MKILAAVLVLVSLTGLVVLPCVCAAEEPAAGHGCCAPRVSIRAADDCCAPPVEQPRVAAPPAPSTVTALPAAIPVFLADERTSPLLAAPMPRRMACARTPILRI